MPDLEGWVDKLYIRIYDFQTTKEINIGYKADEYIPGYTIIGSSDLGDALVVEENTGKLYWIPFVPLDVDHRHSAYDSIDELRRITEEQMVVNDPAKDSHYGLEVHYKHPVVLGGDMWDKENVVFPPRDKHMELCAFWNQVYYRMKNERG
jgi:hypothetical protein